MNGGVRQKPNLKLPASLTEIVEQEYPQFSSSEMQRRRALMAEVMKKSGVDHLIAYAAFFRGGPVHWLSDWLTTYEAVLVFTPGRKDTIFIQFYNHLPQAHELMPEVDFRWGGESTIHSTIDALKQRGAASGRVGAIGLLPMHYYKVLSTQFGEVQDLNRSYFQLRMIKSPEEIDWYRIGARLSDLPIEEMQRELRPGMDEGDIGAMVEGAFLPWRGTNIIHFLGTTSMQNPSCFVPRQHLTTRKLENGDVISCEITASFWEHWGQVLRTFTLSGPPTALYRTLHDVADHAYNAIFNILRPGLHVRELLVGARVIEEAGLSFCDDLVHGFGGGYLPPIIGSPIRQNSPIPDMTLQEGMLLVIQPNVIAKDRRAGVQTGELVVITKDGAQSLHTVPRGLLQLH